LKEFSKQKVLYFSLGIFILIAGIFAVNALIAGTRHAPTNVLVTINSQKMTLQEAINGNYLNQGATLPTSSGTTTLSVGHNPNEIWVYVNQNEMTLQNAIDTVGLCGNSNPKDSYTNYNLNPGHLASEIQYDATQNLQQAIDEGVFCCEDSTWTPATSTVCSGTSFTQTSNCGNTRTATGTKTDGACCEDSTWTPATSTVCSGTSFTQTSNCGNTRTATGTKNCCVNECSYVGQKRCVSCVYIVQNSYGTSTGQKCEMGASGCLVWGAAYANTFDFCSTCSGATYPEVNDYCWCSQEEQYGEV